MFAFSYIWLNLTKKPLEPCDRLEICKLFTNLQRTGNGERFTSRSHCSLHLSWPLRLVELSSIKSLYQMAYLTPCKHLRPNYMCCLSYSGGCERHITGVATGLLGVYLKWLLTVPSLENILMWRFIKDTAYFASTVFENDPRVRAGDFQQALILADEIITTELSSPWTENFNLCYLKPLKA